MEQYFKETTDWGDLEIPNHTYILERGKLVGYIKQYTTEEIRFTKPMFFDKKRRTFVQVK